MQPGEGKLIDTKRENGWNKRLRCPRGGNTGKKKKFTLEKLLEIFHNNESIKAKMLEVNST